MTERDANTQMWELGAPLWGLTEPSPGSIVIDGDGSAWQRGWDSDDWYAACPWTEPMTWVEIIRHFGVAHVFAHSAVLAYLAPGIASGGESA